MSNNLIKICSLIVFTVILVFLGCGDAKTAKKEGQKQQKRSSQKKEQSMLVEGKTYKWKDVIDTMTVDQLNAKIVERVNSVVTLDANQVKSLNEVIEEQQGREVKSFAQKIEYRRKLLYKIQTTIFTPDQQKKYKEFLDKKKNAE